MCFILFRCHCVNNWFGIHCTQKNDVCQDGSNIAICGHGNCYMENNARQCSCTQGWSKDSGE